MTTIRPTASQPVWDLDRSHGSGIFAGFGFAYGETRNNPETGDQEHLIAWTGDQEPTWTNWRHVHDSPPFRPSGSLYCPTCRTRKDVVDEFQDSAYESSREVHYTAKVLECGHSRAFVRATTDTAP